MKLVYFAWLRERIGLPEETIDPPPGVATVAELVAWLQTRGPGYAAAFARPEAVRAAINQTHVKPDATLAPGDEVALFPPVTGG